MARPVPRYQATFADGSTATYICDFLSDGLRFSRENRRPVKVTVTDWGNPHQMPYQMTQSGIERAMFHAKQPAQAPKP
jgi:hypothetical protein